MLTKKRIKALLRPVVKFIKYRILHTNDTPHRIALGVALGIFTAFTPFLGFHLLLLILLAFIFRANKAVALVVVWISNPITYLFIYYPSYLLGHLICSWFTSRNSTTVAQVRASLTEYLSAGYVIDNFFNPEYWRQLRDLFTSISLEVLVGGLVFGTVFALIAYFVIKNLITWYRATRPHWHLIG